MQVEGHIIVATLLLLSATLLYSLTTVNNLLDNAVEVCAHMEPEDKKFIDVGIRIRGFFYMLRYIKFL